MPYDLGICCIRDFLPEDAPALARHANDRRIWINLRDRFPHPYALTDAQHFIATIGAARPCMAFAIEVDGEAAGAIGLEPKDDVERVSAEIGYWLGHAHWSRGIATAALRAVTRHAFVALSMRRVYALPFARNAASCRVLEKAGYQFEGRLRRAAIKDGELLDQMLYACIEPPGGEAVQLPCKERTRP
jgi:RimJ/RimL family protein N-acetyltransferase